MKTKDNKGFTLVELIVVLVILAILAAILVPSLIKYIDEAKNKDKVVTAKALMTAIQSEMANCYAKFSSDKTTAEDIFGEKLNKLKYNNGSTDDPDLTRSTFQENVFKKASISEDPYLVMFYTKNYGTGTGNNFKSEVPKDVSKRRELFNVISVVYWEKEEDKPIFFNFDTNDWEEGNLYTAGIMVRGSNFNTKDYPGGYDKNMILKGHKYDKTRVRIFVLYNRTGKNDIGAINNLIESKVGYTYTKPAKN